jgi:hypothetical protein
MNAYKIRVSDRKWNEWGVVDSYTLKPAPKPVGLDPIKSKLCNQDIFTYKNGNVDILHSSLRCMPGIPGVLVLNNSKTFGKKKNKFLYKCIPDDKRFPVFLVPHKIRIGFSKKMVNKYIVFKYKDWDEKHPHGTIVHVLGEVSKLDNFYEYQLYCKSLYASIQNITKKALQKLKEKTEQQYIDDICSKTTLNDYREIRNIFSIDPSTSKDFDDAFDIEEKEDYIRVSVYISNVSLWMDAMDLWDSFSNRIATIYLPDRKRPMLPTVLSDALCSLTENDVRFAFELKLIIKKNERNHLYVDKYDFHNCVIKVVKNLRYDTEEQETFPDYIKLFNVVNKLNKFHKYTSNIVTSHDVVAYLMIKMNYLCAQKMKEHAIGIFRSAKYGDEFNLPENVPENIQKFLKHWNSLGGRYCKSIDDHEMLNLDAYIHITSPIRRLVDLLNIMKLQDSLGLYTLNENANMFYERWTCDESLEYINTTMRSIRKVQNDCNLLNICLTDEKLLNDVYDGFIFDKIIRNDLLYQYMVYLPRFKMVNRFTSRYDKVNLTSQKFKIYVFEDENTLKHKIRVDLQ